MFIYFLYFQLRKSVVDHVSDSFLETNAPLMLLIEAAQSGNINKVEDTAAVFREHAAKLDEVGKMSYDEYYEIKLISTDI